MTGKPVEAVTKEDIEGLVSQKVPEGRDIEYKEELPRGTDEDTREFLADASSFANAGGGDLLYGIREHRDENGKPTEIPEAAKGLPGINADGQERRLENMLRDGIDPRIPGVRVRHLDGFDSGPVIVLHVPKSWASPHMVKFKNRSRFFSRTSAGKYQLDFREIRAAFLASESLGDKISAFRSDRVGKILAGETPLALESGPKIVLHLLPVRAFGEPATVDLHAAQSSPANSLEPMGPYGAGRGPVEFNFNGLYCSSGSGASPQTNSYVQLFRNGAVEAVCKWEADRQALFGGVLDQELVRAVPLYRSLQERLGVGAPLFIAISALAVKGFRIWPILTRNPLAFRSARPIDQDVLLAPEVLVEDEGGGAGDSLRPALDTIWQASGWAGSQGFDESGKWVGFARFLR
jgi:hypothetical protein